MDHDLSVKRFITAVIDGTNEELVYFIQSTIDEITKEKYGESTRSPLDNGTSSMMLIKTITDPDTYETIRFVVETALPGRCLFDYTV